MWIHFALEHSSSIGILLAACADPFHSVCVTLACEKIVSFRRNYELLYTGAADIENGNDTWDTTAASRNHILHVC